VRAVVCVEREFVRRHGVARLRVDDVGEFCVLTAWRGSAAGSGWEGGVRLGVIVWRLGSGVDAAAALGVGARRGGGAGRGAGRSESRGVRARWGGHRRGALGDVVVEDVEGDFAGGFDGGGLVGIVGLKVAIKDILEVC